MHNPSRQRCRFCSNLYYKNTECTQAGWQETKQGVANPSPKHYEGNTQSQRHKWGKEL
jgi:hypothetical protein